MNFQITADCRVRLAQGHFMPCEGQLNFPIRRKLHPLPRCPVSKDTLQKGAWKQLAIKLAAMVATYVRKQGEWSSLPARLFRTKGIGVCSMDLMLHVNTSRLKASTKAIGGKLAGIFPSQRDFRLRRVCVLLFPRARLLDREKSNLIVSLSISAVKRRSSPLGASDTQY